APQRLIFLDEPTVFERPLDQQLDLFAVEGLLDVIVSAELHRLDGGLHAGEGGHEDDRHFRPQPLHFSQQFDSAHLRHLQVGDQNCPTHGRAARATRRPVCVCPVLNTHTSNLAPPFSWLDAEIVPSWASMIRWTIASPRPVPVSLVVKNGLKMRSSTCGAIPG